MTLLEAILMGILQGVAEFLPISSSGHLALFKGFFNINTETGLLFDVLLHLGTLVAIFIAYWKDIKELIIEGFTIVGLFITNLVIGFSRITGSKKNFKPIITTPYRRFVMLVIVSTIPTGIIGIMFESVIEAASATMLVPGLFLILTGILLTIADRVKVGKKNEAAATYKDAGLIGLAQGIATMPGLSRSGTTITACLLCGFKKDFAVKYSFIMSIPAVLGALVLQLKDFNQISVTSIDLVNYGVGTVIACVVGYISIRTMLVIVRGKKFKFFAYYCFIIGLVAIIGNFVVA